MSQATEKEQEQTSHVWISCRLQSSKASSDGGSSAAKPAEALLECSRLHEDRADAIEDKAENEGGAVAEAAEDEVDIVGGCEKVGVKVSCLEVEGADDVESVLKMIVEGVKEAVGDALLRVWFDW